MLFIGWELPGVLLAHALGTALVAAVGLEFVRPSVSVPRWRHVRSLFDFTKFSWLGTMCKKLFSNIETIVFGFLIPAELTGTYAVAYTREVPQYLR